MSCNLPDAVMGMKAYVAAETAVQTVAAAVATLLHSVQTCRLNNNSLVNGRRPIPAHN
jgi:hypothetical protein